jgi:hypothetical protein
MGSGKMKKWGVEEIPFDMKLKLFISVGIPHPRLKPTFHYPTIPLFHCSIVPGMKQSNHPK